MLIEKRFMELALAEARAARDEGEIPVGAVIVRGGEVISRAHNTTGAGMQTEHAEMNALAEAIKVIGERFLEDCALYVTMEPCPMCAGACLLFRVGAVVYGAYDKRAGAMGSVKDIANGNFGYTIPVIGGVMREECAELLSNYFKEKR